MYAFALLYFQKLFGKKFGAHQVMVELLELRAS